MIRLWHRRPRELSDVQKLVADYRAEHDPMPRLRQLATVVIDEHTDADGVCAQCGEAFPCAAARTAEMMFAG